MNTLPPSDLGLEFGAMQSISTTDSYNHKIQNFIQPQEIKVVCNDTTYTGVLFEETFNIQQDLTAPSVTLTMDEVVSSPGMLTANANEPVVCYYNVSQAWVIFDGTYREEESDYSTIQTQGFDVGTMLVDQSSNTIMISCIDKAENNVFCCSDLHLGVLCREQ